MSFAVAGGLVVRGELVAAGGPLQERLLIEAATSSLNLFELSVSFFSSTIQRLRLFHALRSLIPFSKTLASQVLTDCASTDLNSSLSDIRIVLLYLMLVQLRKASNWGWYDMIFPDVVALSVTMRGGRQYGGGRSGVDI